MARDPNKTARNKAIIAIKDELRSMLDSVMYEIDRDNELSVNAFIGSKNDDFIDLKNEVIRTPQEFISKWVQGLDKGYREGRGGRYTTMYEALKNPHNKNFKKYCNLFLTRSFLKRYDSLSKVRPLDDEAFYWFGLNDSYLGLFITPRFNPVINDWENDKSEIRVFDEIYWTIGHVLKAGLCYPGLNKKKTFQTVEDYLSFFYDQVRLTKSTYQLEIANKYIEFVESVAEPRKVPLLIPEVRFEPGKKHIHRLDFLVVNPYTMDKIGIELSPWSTHGQLSGKHKTLTALNSEALENFEREIKKIKAYFKKHKIYTLIFPDSDLTNMDTLFEQEIKKYLTPNVPPEQLSLNLINDFFT